MRSVWLASAALFMALMYAQQEAEPQNGLKAPEMATLEGRVVGAIKGEPVRKANLLLWQKGKPEGRRYLTATDARGAFILQDVEPGKYRLMVTKGGYARVEYGARGPNHPGSTISLDPGQHVHDLVVRLTPQAVISGRVIDEDGEPVANLSVQLCQYVYGGGRPKLDTSGFASTNDLGEYRLFDLAPGRYYLGASPQNDADAEDGYAPTFYPASTDPAGATTLDVRPGTQLRGVDITLIKVRTVLLRGRAILPEKGPRIQQVNVELTPRDQARRFFGASSPALDAQGAFEFRGVIPGAYFLIAQSSQDGRSYGARQAIDVGQTNIDNLVLELIPIPEVKGQLQIEGRTVANLAGIHIMLEPEGNEYLGWPGGSLHNDGSFTLSNIAAAHYQLHMNGLTEDYYIKSASLGDKDVLESGLDGARLGTGALTIVVSSLGGQVEGVVLNADEQPAAGAAVVLVPEAARRSQSRLYKEVTTDQYGRFDIKGIAPGDYKLFAWEDVETGAYEDPDFLKTFEALGESFTIRAGSHESRELKLIPSDAKKAN